MSVSLIDGHIDSDAPRMTDNEIIEALEHDAISEFDHWVIDLINRQKVEVERLKKINDLYPFKVKVGHNSEVHSKSIQDYDSFIGGVSAEAVKEFAERLKKKAEIVSGGDYGFTYEITEDEIDNLVKEMVGDAE